MLHFLFQLWQHWENLWLPGITAAQKYIGGMQETSAAHEMFSVYSTYHVQGSYCAFLERSIWCTSNKTNWL